jgi:murein DD-endopeptidase MepM/ murein hydrolase activator NlpD
MRYAGLLVVAAMVAAVGVATPGPTHAIPVGAPTAVWDYRAPVAAPVLVVRAFEAPLGPYAAGHRGVDLAVGTDRTVHATQGGQVSFAGQVAGRGVVVLVHADGVRTEYEPVVPAVRTGSKVERGALLGSVAGRHGTCAPDRCLHWGARRDGVYFDPMSLLARLGPVRLVPWDR